MLDDALELSIVHEDAAHQWRVGRDVRVALINEIRDTTRTHLLPTPTTGTYLHGFPIVLDPNAEGVELRDAAGRLLGRITL